MSTEVEKEKKKKKTYESHHDTYPVNSNIDPRRHCPLWGPCMILAGLVDAPRGSECATSSIRSTDGPPRLVLRLESRLGPCLTPISLDVPSPLLQLSLVASESDTTTVSGAPCVELELSLRKRPMIDLGCFGFSMPPVVG